jgi:hypothetical protein
MTTCRRCRPRATGRSGEACLLPLIVAIRGRTGHPRQSQECAVPPAAPSPEEEKRQQGLDPTPFRGARPDRCAPPAVMLCQAWGQWLADRPGSRARASLRPARLRAETAAAVRAPRYRSTGTGQHKDEQLPSCCELQAKACRSRVPWPVVPPADEASRACHSVVDDQRKSHRDSSPAPTLRADRGTPLDPRPARSSLKADLTNRRGLERNRHHISQSAARAAADDQGTRPAPGRLGWNHLSDVTSGAVRCKFGMS